jgi:hypothetical protein
MFDLSHSGLAMFDLSHSGLPMFDLSHSGLPMFDLSHVGLPCFTNLYDLKISDEARLAINGMYSTQEKGAKNSFHLKEYIVKANNWKQILSPI